jgi:hypothetical protein
LDRKRRKEMNTHYIPRLLLRPFAIGERINTYNFTTNAFESKKLKNTFSGNKLFDEELEMLFANKLEGPFGNMLNHKLLHVETINLNRQENLLLRKFLMINFLRAPIVNTSWSEMVKRAGLEDHPSVQAREFLIRHHPEMKTEFDKMTPSKENYILNLKKAMEVDSLENLAEEREEFGVSEILKIAARRAMAAVIAFWDVTDIDQEFILPKLPGISEMDYVSIFYKSIVLQERRHRLEAEWLPDDLDRELKRLQIGSVLFTENYSIYPISPTRCIVCFSPYFKAFFNIMDTSGRKILYPPLLKKEEFKRHFYNSQRLELFEPCDVKYNQSYTYKAKQLSDEELYQINSMILNMETEEIAFHDKNKIKTSFEYYDKKAVFAIKKKHDFSNLY